jgi:hypothetical protein
MKTYKFTNNQKINLHAWAEWLEETDFLQGYRSLKKHAMTETMTPNGPVCFCALGVFIEYSNSARFRDEPNEWGEYPCQMHVYIPECCTTTHLPDGFARKLGIYSNTRNSFQVNIIEMNDILVYSFKEIAEEVRYLADNGCFTKETQEKLNSI